MEKKVDIAALGELLINFTEAGYRQDGRKLFEQNPGGAPANLLTDAVIEDPAYFTTLAFVENDETGERKFSFARKPGADTHTF